MVFLINVEFSNITLLENLMRPKSKELRKFILKLTRFVKQLIVVFVDIIFCVASVIAAYFAACAIIALEEISLLPIICQSY